MKRIKSVYSRFELAGGWKEFARIYVPTRQQNGDPIFKRDELLKDVQNILTKEFGGTTTFEAYGTWRDDDGNPHEENISVIEAFAIKDKLTKEDKQIVRELSERISIAANQLAVTRIVNGMINFINGSAQEIEGHLENVKGYLDAMKDHPNVSINERVSMVEDLEAILAEYRNLRANLGKNLQLNWKDQIMIAKIEDFISRLNLFQTAINEREDLEKYIRDEANDLSEEMKDLELAEMREIMRESTPEMFDPAFS